MQILAYCSANVVEPTRRAAGVDPLVCPPVTADTLDLSLLENKDLLFFNLHSLPRAPFLGGSVYGTPVALKAHQLDGLDLGGAVVFTTACYLGDAVHPMREALLDAGASAVIAGAGKNWGSKVRQPFGADLLGLWFRRFLSWGISTGLALRLAKRMIRRSKTLAVKDSLDFKIFRRNDDQ